MANKKPLYPLSQGNFTKAQMATIGYALVGYLEETAPGEDDEIGGADLTEEVCRILNYVHKGGR